MNSNSHLYIAGPMSGIQEYNKPEFDKAEYTYRKMGFKVFNPINSSESRLVQDGKMSGQEAYRACLSVDLDYICKVATHIYMLKGWEKSLGSRAEHATATALGLEIMYQ